MKKGKFDNLLNKPDELESTKLYNMQKILNFLISLLYFKWSKTFRKDNIQ